MWGCTNVHDVWGLGELWQLNERIGEINRVLVLGGTIVLMSYLSLQHLWIVFEFLSYYSIGCSSSGKIS